ncbi:DUF2061 domain-containing protein [Pseudohaliea rubra]|uniref:DUF2061 domain-containing protein n=1 Tax=Pseudohaliea rubra DSM 19751 TaxID=1265313 RepID=A0A095VNZ5_9GAMM|nr:DUF2061 domain-containing protein [Pseudohaliea rubra]KGE03177.1 hypothetical protein HRUBRA_02217 [Pseudohaliea rubra DSM 19751]
MAGKKTLSFALVHFSVAFAVGWLVTGSPWLGGTLAVLEPMVNTVAFYLHERAWQSGAPLSAG